MKMIPTLCIAALACMLINTADAAPKQRVACKIHKSKVNTPWEKRADTDNNGRISPSERKDVREKRVVDTKREERIDRNDDGVIGRVEARHAWRHRQVAKNNR